MNDVLYTSERPKDGSDPINVRGFWGYNNKDRQPQDREEVRKAMEEDRKLHKKER